MYTYIGLKLNLREPWEIYAMPYRWGCSTRHPIGSRVYLWTKQRGPVGVKLNCQREIVVSPLQVTKYSLAGVRIEEKREGPGSGGKVSDLHKKHVTLETNPAPS
jgi:hypothetical protein